MAILILGGLTFSYFVYLYLTKQSIPFFSSQTTGAYYSSGIIISKDPFDLNLKDIKLLDRQKANIKDKLLIADPFLFENNKEFYMFFEIMGKTGADIGVAKVNEDNELEYLGVVLDETKHLSYPLVFREGEHIYMIPESQALNAVKLYEAVDFPLKWEFKKDILKNERMADPTVFKKDAVWYMLAEKSKNLHLFYSDSILGEWQEHPKSPVRTGNYTRPAGRMFHHSGKLIRFGQDSYGGYGRQVYGFVIDSLSKTNYKESDIKNNPVVSANGNGWAKNGMHHIDIHKKDDGSFIIALDGRGYGKEKIIFSLD